MKNKIKQIIDIIKEIYSDVNEMLSFLFDSEEVNSMAISDDNINVNLPLLSEADKENIRRQLAPFTDLAKEIERKSLAITKELESKGIMLKEDEIYNYYSDVLHDMADYMNKLQSSIAYKKIHPLVMDKVYRQIAEKHINAEERYLDNNYLSDEEKLEIKSRISEAKQLLKFNPEMAAELYRKLGYCYEVWGTTYKILKEDFGVIYYSPQDLNPDTYFD